QRLGLFFISSNLIEQCLESAGMFARLDQIDEQIIEVEGVLGERLVQRGTGLDIRLHRQNELLHRWLVVAISDYVETLHHRDTRLKHRRELSREERNVFRRDFLAAFEKLRLFPYSLRENALTAQIRFYGRLGHSE